jgi:hypothetical protein
VRGPGATCERTVQLDPFHPQVTLLGGPAYECPPKSTVSDRAPS